MNAMNARKTTWPRLARVTLAFGLVLVLASTFTSPALAGEIVTGEPDAIIPEDEVIDDDLVITGARVEVNGTVTGDLFAAGQQVIINGVVEGNVFAAGQFITVNGKIDGGMIVMSYSFTVGPQADVARNVYFGGFAFEAQEGSNIGRNLYAGNYQTVLNGVIGRDVTVGAGAFEVNGQVGGDIYAEIGKLDEQFDESSQYWTAWLPGGVSLIAPGLRVGEDAQVDGEFVYAIRPVDVEPPEVPDVTFAVREATQGAAGWAIANWVRTRLGEFVSLLIVGGLLLYFQRQNLSRVAQQIKERPLPSLGWGLVVFLLFPVAVLIAIALLIALVILGSIITLGSLTGTLIQLGGVTIASVCAVFGFLLWLVTKAVFGYLVGWLILTQLSPETLQGRWGNALALLIGVLLYEIARAVPILGALFALLVVLIGIGAIFEVLRARLRASKAAA